MPRNQTTTLSAQRWKARQPAPARISPRITWNGEPASTYLSYEQWRAITFSLGLTPRQEQIVRRIVDGLYEREIGQEMRISVYTVHSHIARIYRNIGVTSRSELITRLFLVVLARGSRDDSNES